MGWAARANQALRAKGLTPEPYPRTRSGPRWYHLRMTDAFGAIYREVPNERVRRNDEGVLVREVRGRRIVRAVTKVRGKAARRADKQARRPHCQAA